MSTLQLTVVRDVYGWKTYVETEQLAGADKRLRCYHADGRRVMSNDLGFHAADWTPVVLLRENICPHGDEHWEIRSFPDRTTYPCCRLCDQTHQEQLKAVRN